MIMGVLIDVSREGKQLTVLLSLGASTFVLYSNIIAD